jgi:hypothetical protein
LEEKHGGQAIATSSKLGFCTVIASTIAADPATRVATHSATAPRLVRDIIRILDPPCAEVDDQRAVWNPVASAKFVPDRKFAAALEQPTATSSSL